MTTRDWIAKGVKAALEDPNVVRAFLDALDNYWAAEYGGMRLQRDQAKRPESERIQRETRVAVAMEQGATPDEIARKEGISVRHARRLRGRLRGPVP